MLRFEALHLRRDDFGLDVDWGVAAGARVALIGPSGAGKSTLLAAVAGFLAPASGRVLWGQQDLTPLPASQRPMTILFQDHNLFPHLTAVQNIGLGLDPALKLDDAQRAEVETALDRVGLLGLGARRPAELSGGQQSRVALARAFLRARPILLLDEPFAALGPGLKAEMLGLLDELLRQTRATLLYVTHDPRDAEALGGLTSVVADGDAAKPVETAQLLADPTAALRAYLGT